MCVLVFVHVDIVTAVPRYDDDTYTGRIIVYNPDDYMTIQNVNARGTQVCTCMCSMHGSSVIVEAWPNIDGKNLLLTKISGSTVCNK